MARMMFSMPVLPPFRLDLTVWALRRRVDNAVDNWDGRTYLRALKVDTGAIELAAVQVGSFAAPEIAVTLTGTTLDQRSEQAARVALTHLLGLELDLSPFYRLAESDPLLRTLAERFRGVKPPRFPTLFECIVNAIACQQLSLTVGIRLLNRFVEAHGATPANSVIHAFPDPTLIAGLAPETLKHLGFSGSKARSIVELAAAIGAGTFAPKALETLDDHEAIQALLQLHGVGRWSAEYTLLRGLEGCTSSPATTSAPATTLPAGSSAGGRSITRASKPPCALGSRLAGSSTFTCCSGTLSERGTLTTADRSQEGVQKWVSS